MEVCWCRIDSVRRCDWTSLCIIGNKWSGNTYALSGGLLQASTPQVLHADTVSVAYLGKQSVMQSILWLSAQLMCHVEEEQNSGTVHLPPPHLPYVRRRTHYVKVCPQTLWEPWISKTGETVMKLSKRWMVWGRRWAPVGVCGRSWGPVDPSLLLQMLLQWNWFLDDSCLNSGKTQQSRQRLFTRSVIFHFWFLVWLRTCKQMCRNQVFFDEKAKVE